MSIRILVVDDTVVFRRLISDALAGAPGIEVVGTASNGRLALSRLTGLKPDLITLDIEMPEMNGLEVLEAMRAQGLTSGVILLSSHTRRGGEMTMRALELGAFDFITKPEGPSADQNRDDLRAQLLPMIRAFEQRSSIRALLQRKVAPVAPAASKPNGAVRRGETAAPIEAPAAGGIASFPPAPTAALRRGDPIVLIGVSTGGPAALARVLPGLPADLGAPVFVVQHMPPLFTATLAESLAKKCNLPVKEAGDGEFAEPNCVYVAPGGRHMKLAPGSSAEIMVRITDDPPENNCRPAVDYLFRSAALHFPGRATAVILTGMGNDGTLGLRLLKRSGCVSIAQDEASSVVFGMPREAIAAGVVDTVKPLDGIAAAIIRSVREGKA